MYIYIYIYVYTHMSHLHKCVTPALAELGGGGSQSLLGNSSLCKRGFSGAGGGTFEVARISVYHMLV